jgi:hypothetical protein
MANILEGIAYNTVCKSVGLAVFKEGKSPVGLAFYKMGSHR